MTIIRPRGRPRVKSADFSRLWWLVATEAAFQVHAAQVHPALRDGYRTTWAGDTYAGLAARRRNARLYLARKGVIV